MPDIKSPAVQSLEDDEKTKRNEPDALEAGLEGTFPGSDPVPATTTTIPGVAESGSDTPDLDQVTAAPLVDEALEAVATHGDGAYLEARNHIAAVRDEIESVGYRGSTMADNVRSVCGDRPMRALGLAALVGFIWGMTY